MNLSISVSLLLVAAGLGSAFARPGGQYPRPYMVGGSFYSNPRYVRGGPEYQYFPPGQMTAMVVGDTVATNSFSGSPYRFNPPNVEQIENDQASEQVTEKLQPAEDPDYINEAEAEQFTTESTTKVVPVVPSREPSVPRKSKKANKRPVTPAAPPAEEEEDEEEDSGLSAAWPFAARGNGGIPAYNSFFPIYIGGGPSSRRSSPRSADAQEGGFPGSATAIANAFSTGKGGVATSHATSFGDPYAAAMFRNSEMFNFKTKNRKQAVQEIDD